MASKSRELDLLIMNGQEHHQSYVFESIEEITGAKASGTDVTNFWFLLTAVYRAELEGSGALPTNNMDGYIPKLKHEGVRAYVTKARKLGLVKTERTKDGGFLVLDAAGRRWLCDVLDRFTDTFQVTSVKLE